MPPPHCPLQLKRSHPAVRREELGKLTFLGFSRGCLLTPGYRWLRDSPRTHFITSLQKVPEQNLIPGHRQRPSVKKRCHNVMEGISVLGLKVQLQHLPVVWYRGKSSLPWLSFVIFKIEPTQKQLSKDKRLKTCDVLTRSWQMINIYLSISLALIHAW